MASRDVFSDQEILEALRAAASMCGEPLSHTRYDGVSHKVGGPSSARIIQRFGSWSGACESAGVASGVTSREYKQRWDRSAVVSAVREYLAGDGAAGTYADFTAWAAADPDRPSGATVRNVLGGWNAAKEQASGS